MKQRIPSLYTFINESKDPKASHFETRKTKSVTHPEYPFYAIKDYMEVGYWDKVKKADFKKAYDTVMGYLLRPGSNSEKLSKDYNWITSFEDLWQYQQNKED